jgi:hypothetical protein
VHRSTVARWLVSVKQELLAQATQRVKQQLGIDTREAESLCALIRSQIDISLGALDGERY